MTRETLADRIVNYCDAVVAFSVVNAFAFVIALGEPDIRCSMAEIWTFCALANLVFATTSTGVLLALRRFENVLRVGTEASASASDSDGGDAGDALVEGFWRLANRVRIGLVWFFSLIVHAGILAATRDSTCVLVGS